MAILIVGHFKVRGVHLPFKTFNKGGKHSRFMSTLIYEKQVLVF